MKGTAADQPYEFFRWKSSCGRLAVRTTWVKGVRHVILSDDDVTDERPPSEKEKRPRLQHKNSSNSAPNAKTNRPPLSVVNRKNNNNNNNNNHHNNGKNNNNNDDSYVERVLQWLQKPSGGVLETCQKPMSAPGNGGGSGVRRPALIKTFSIPENKFVHQQVAEVARRPATTKSSGGSSSAKNHQKTELHVHMPSTCPASTGNGDIVYDDILHRTS